MELKRDQPILLIDDEESIAETLCELLQSFDFKVEMTCAGEFAKDLISSRQFSLIVCDVNLGGKITSDELIRLAKNRNPTQAVVMMSGDIDRRDLRIQALLQAYPDISTLEKPFDVSAIVNFFPQKQGA